jgi:hypothetical protein
MAGTISCAIIGFAAFVMFVLVIIKLFQREGMDKGILGLVFPPYAFIRGWKRHRVLGLTTIMIAWSVLIGLSLLIVVFTVLSGLASSAAQ